MRSHSNFQYRGFIAKRTPWKKVYRRYSFLRSRRQKTFVWRFFFNLRVMLFCRLWQRRIRRLSRRFVYKIKSRKLAFGTIFYTLPHIEVYGWMYFCFRRYHRKDKGRRNIDYMRPVFRRWRFNSCRFIRIKRTPYKLRAKLFCGMFGYRHTQPTESINQSLYFIENSFRFTVLIIIFFTVNRKSPLETA